MPKKKEQPEQPKKRGKGRIPKSEAPNAVWRNGAPYPPELGQRGNTFSIRSPELVLEALKAETKELGQNPTFYINSLLIRELKHRLPLPNEQ